MCPKGEQCDPESGNCVTVCGPQKQICSPPSVCSNDKCIGDPCQESCRNGFQCNPKTGECEESPCEETCRSGTRCNIDTGKCETVCGVKHVFCPPPSKCLNGRCENSCGECPRGTVCDRETQTCGQQCLKEICIPPEVCNRGRCKPSLKNNNSCNCHDVI